jgi:hypothetical protein
MFRSIENERKSNVDVSLFLCSPFPPFNGLTRLVGIVEALDYLKLRNSANCSKPDSLSGSLASDFTPCLTQIFDRSSEVFDFGKHASIADYFARKATKVTPAEVKRYFRPPALYRVIEVVSIYIHRPLGRSSHSSPPVSWSQIMVYRIATRKPANEAPISRPLGLGQNVSCVV